MTENSTTPPFVLAAVKRIYDSLPTLVGEDWPHVAEKIDTYLHSLEQNAEDYLASTLLFGLLSEYEPARQRLTEELTIQAEVAANIAVPLAEMQFDPDNTVLAAMMAGLNWEVDPTTIPLPESSERELRSMTLKNAGVGGGRSIKLKNLDLDLGKMMTVAAGFLLAGQNILDQPSAFVIAGGLLVMMGTLLGEMTVKIEQQEATVFWGFIMATNKHPKDRQASTKSVFTTTNAERHKRGLPELSDEQFKYSLFKLEQLGSITHVDGNTYRIIEHFKVKG